MKKWLLIVAFIVLMFSISLAAYIVLTYTAPNSESGSTSGDGSVNYTYKVINTYPHDTGAFTEGLAYEDGFLYESTGLNGESTLRKLDLTSGKPLQQISIASDFFGEGMTIFRDKIVQLTWQSQKGFVYDRSSFDLLAEFSYRGEGWGITNDGDKLIMSNGSATVSFLDPNTYKVLGEIQVKDGESLVINLNELEYINGDLYANVWHQNRIAIINIQTGQVKGWINLAGLYNDVNAGSENVLNGIAYDAQRDRLFVTGKRWSQLFEIELEQIS